MSRTWGQEMIISEKQVVQLIQIAHVYQTALDTLYKFDKTLLSNCGLHNKIEIANILMEIANQQSEELKVIE
jgi:predicted nucleotidyltransferase